MSLSGLRSESPVEIQERLKRRFLDRLSRRVKKIRLLMLEKSWEEIRAECHQLRASGATFSFQELTRMSELAERAIPQESVSRARALPEAKHAVESLLGVIDQILMENPIHR